MSTEKNSVRISDSTEEQPEQQQEFEVEELEERIAPAALNVTGLEDRIAPTTLVPRPDGN